MCLWCGCVGGVLTREREECYSKQTSRFRKSRRRSNYFEQNRKGRLDKRRGSAVISFSPERGAGALGKGAYAHDI